MFSKLGTKSFLKIKNLNFSYFSTNGISLKKKLTSIKNLENKKEIKIFENLNLEISQGKKVGLFSSNGSGKTTLLKIITNIYPVEKKYLETQGKILNMISIGGGFKDEATGLENIYIEGYLNGYNKNQIKEKMEEIVKFADIGDFIGFPVRIYSSGMRMRLAFSIIVNFPSDIIIMDEWLSVGDNDFNEKAQKKLAEKINDKILLIASHDLNLLNNLCDEIYTISNYQLIKKF